MTRREQRENGAAWQPGPFLCSLSGSLRKCPGVSQPSKAIGRWRPWLSHFLLSARFQNCQGDLLVRRGCHHFMLWTRRLWLVRLAAAAGGGVWTKGRKKRKKNKQNDILFLTNFLIGRQKGLARRPGRDVRLIPEKRGRKTKRDTWGRPLSRFLFFLFWHWISEQDGCLFAFSTRSPRRLWKQEEEDVGERHQNFSAVR